MMARYNDLDGAPFVESVAALRSGGIVATAGAGNMLVMEENRKMAEGKERKKACAADRK